MISLLLDLCGVESISRLTHLGGQTFHMVRFLSHDPSFWAPFEPFRVTGFNKLQWLQSLYSFGWDLLTRNPTFRLTFSLLLFFPSPVLGTVSLLCVNKLLEARIEVSCWKHTAFPWLWALLAEMSIIFYSKSWSLREQNESSLKTNQPRAKWHREKSTSIRWWWRIAIMFFKKIRKRSDSDYTLLLYVHSFYF